MYNLTELKRRSPEALLAGMTDKSQGVSIEAGLRLTREAKDFGLSMQDYLKVACDPRLSETPAKFDGLNGFESSLMLLNLPFRNDFENGVMLQAASDTFQTFPGTRAMFPEVIDQMLRFKSRQDQIENTASFIAQSRTIAGTELISTAVESDATERGSYSIGEFGKIPVRTLRTSQTSVGIFKHGSGIMTSYEFERRASLDILTPFAARVQRELEISKVRAATYILLNGDTVNGAASAASISSYGGTAVDGSHPLSGQYKAVAKWMVARAKAGTPVDIIMGDLDMYLELLFMFTPTLAGQRSEIEAITAKGGPSINVNIPLLGGNATFVISSAMPANKLLGFTKSETIEELVESGSSIAENQRSIENQSVMYTRTENTGYKIAYGDTRSLLDVAS